ncbi:sigma factor-like helix-turn-helix DNA-binding protein [Streptomyces niveus]|uniref:sigma factor-like helix-turn-helix DNA-binding protein n=1 Tax=Streptomyces niveus TaxID=193462 RepID=UPI0036A429AA
MRERRQAGTDRRRAREFEAFVAGAAGRLLHVATLLTGEPAGVTPHAERLLTAALARTYADWDRLRDADPYDRVRTELATRYARGAWRLPRSGEGLLGRLGPRERLILVLRLYEGVAEEQTAALLGLPVERVRAICARAVTAMRRPAPAARPAPHWPLSLLSPHSRQAAR